MSNYRFYPDHPYYVKLPAAVVGRIFDSKDKELLKSYIDLISDRVNCRLNYEFNEDLNYTYCFHFKRIEDKIYFQLRFA